MIVSNQPIGLNGKSYTKSYIFSKQEFKSELVPPYAFDLKEKDGYISFTCQYTSKGKPVYPDELNHKQTADT